MRKAAAWQDRNLMEDNSNPAPRQTLGDTVRDLRVADRQLGRLRRFRSYFRRIRGSLIAVVFLGSLLLAFGWPFLPVLVVGLVLIGLIEIARRRASRRSAKGEPVS